MQRVKFIFVNLETLSSSLILKEKELLLQYKDKLEEQDLEQNLKNYEKRRLLEASDSEDEEDKKSEDSFEFADSKVAFDPPEELMTAKAEQNHTQ